MDVTAERFRFTTQWFNDPDATYNSLGPLAAGGPAATWTLTNDLQAQKLFGSGGQLLVEIANTLTWNLIGHSQTNNTIASFSLMQPLLRNAGRAFVMERLTLVERTLLYSIRQMEQYRRAYFAFIATGRSTGTGPQRVGGVFGTAGLGGFTGVGTNGFGQVGTAVAATANPALGGSSSGAGAGAGEWLYRHPARHHADPQSRGQRGRPARQPGPIAGRLRSGAHSIVSRSTWPGSPST